jgi:hypothetical protein|tara:strand:- start:673 stop:774 length:102 start_codon:yes stop_codon:yes gene_type:complete
MRMMAAFFFASLFGALIKEGNDKLEKRRAKENL